MENTITKDLKTIILELQPGEPIALNRLAELVEQDNSTCESKLKQLLDSNQINGKYSDFSQVFILGETTLFCQVDGGNFPSSLAHHTCPSCGRYVCGRCIGQLIAVGLVACAYCDTEFDPKPVIETMTSSMDLKLRIYGECLKLVDERNYEAAVEAFREYLIDNEDDASSWFNLAYSYSMLERYIEAIECWGKGVKLQTKDTSTLVQQADKIQPDDVDTQNYWSVALKTLSRIMEAFQKYQKAGLFQPDDANILYYWGLSLNLLGHREEACVKYQQANKIRPEHTGTLIDWGATLCLLGRYKEAIQKFQQAHKMQPEDADILHNWGTTLCHLERYEEGIQKFQQVNKIRPEHSGTLTNWGIALEKLKQFEKAKRMYLRAATAARNAGDVSSAEKHERYVQDLSANPN